LVESLKVQESASLQFALRDGVNRDLIEGPRMASSGGCVSLNGGHGDANVLAPDRELPRLPNVADTVDEMAVVVRRDLKYGAERTRRRVGSAPACAAARARLRTQTRRRRSSAA